MKKQDDYAKYKKVERGDLLFYKKGLWYCDGKVGKDKFSFSNPYVDDIVLARSEIVEIRTYNAEHGTKNFFGTYKFR